MKIAPVPSWFLPELPLVAPGKRRGVVLRKPGRGWNYFLSFATVLAVVAGVTVNHIGLAAAARSPGSEITG